MLTQNAKNGFEELLEVCLSESLNTSEFSSWKLQKKPIEDITEKEIFMFTISSYEFRIFLILHFSQSERVSNYIAKLLKVESEQLQASRFYDCIGEIGNGFCGNYKRELGRYFPFLGMSTPNLLEIETLQHLKIWDYDHEAHCIATYNNEINFCGSVYICGYNNIDFKYSSHSFDEDDVDSGELELF